MKFYLEGVIEWLSKITHEVKLFNFDMTCDDFTFVMQNIPLLTESISFPHCRIKIADDLDFGKVEYKLKKLSFVNAEITWSKGIEEAFRIIIDEIADSPIQDNLESIIVSESVISSRVIQDMLDSNELNHIKALSVEELSFRM